MIQRRARQFGNLLFLAVSVFLTVVLIQRAPRYSIVVIALAAAGIILNVAMVLESRRRGSSSSDQPRSTLAVFRRRLLRVLLLAALVTWWIFRPAPPMGSGPAGPDVDAAAFAQPWRTQPVLLVSLGDSVSTGFGAPPGQGFPRLMIRNVDAVYPEMAGRDLASVLPELAHHALAANSTNSIEHKQEIERIPIQDANTFGIVTMTCGGIDLIHSYGKFRPKEGAMYGATLEEAMPWIASYEERLDAMMQLLVERFPGGLAVFMATIYDPTDGVGDIENAGPHFWLPPWPDGLEILRRFNDAIRSVTARHDFAYVADVHGTMLGHGIHCEDEDNPHHDPDDPGYWYYRNLEDPNPRGHDAIRRVFLNAMAKAVPR